MDDFFLDTNILVLAHNKTGEKKHEIAKELYEDCLKATVIYHLSLQNLGEFFNVATKGSETNISNEEVTRAIKDIVEIPEFIIHEPTQKTLLDAMKIHTQYKIYFWDAMIVAVMKKAGIHSIYTEDSHFKKIPWINAVNPFE